MKIYKEGIVRNEPVHHSSLSIDKFIQIKINIKLNFNKNNLLSF